MNERSADVVEVVPISGVDKQLAYSVPPPCAGVLRVGSLVRVPLRSRRELGVVARFGSDATVTRSKLKSVIDVVQEHPVLPPDLMDLFRWIRTYYAATSERVLETMIPAAIRRGMRPKTRRYLEASPAADDAAVAELGRKAPRQAELLDFVRGQLGPAPRAPLLKRLGVPASACAALVEKGLLLETDAREERSAYDDEMSDAERVEAAGPTLTEEQARAGANIAAALDAGGFAVRLLHGVTGSGKTEVYLRAIERVLEENGSVIFLVPEVALAPQTVGRLRSRLEARGVRTVVWHSQLAEGERYDAWRAVASGEANVVVGARSAIFAPVQRLRLVIVDEEHEPSYKQEEAPRYNGRDVAVYRAKLNGAVCVLGSATPSLESLHNVERGKYGADRMLRRVDDRRLPKIHLADMRREHGRGGGAATLSRMLADKLQDRFEKREQSILFLNRRGFSTRMLCPDCGHVATCGHCSIPMTYHRADGRLRCHLCGHERPAPRHCPECRGANVRWRGHGTQKIEAIVAKLLPPNARVVRMDADSMARKNLYRKILGDFRKGNIDVLVGTQMIAKGLDFPNVTLVGLVDADSSLYIEDFRAAERTFQLIVQVSGRSGRGDRAGEVVIQTHTPHSPPIQFARQSDFDGFQMEELEQRREFHYPPFRHLVRHLFRGRNPDKVAFCIEQWARRVEAHFGDALEIRGPAPAPIEKLRDEYRFHLWYFCDSAASVVPRLQALREEFGMERDVAEIVDVDPMNLG